MKIKTQVLMIWFICVLCMPVVSALGETRTKTDDWTGLLSDGTLVNQDELATILKNAKTTKDVIKEQYKFKTDLREARFKGALLTGQNLQGLDLKGVDLSGANLRDANLSNANLSNANLRGANLADANLEYTSLAHANLTNASLFQADLKRTNLENAILHNANLKHATLIFVNLEKSDLTGASMRGTELRETRMKKSRLVSADLGGAKLVNITMQGADLQGVQFYNSHYGSANVDKIDWEGANLEKVDLHHIRLKLIGCNFKGTNLSHSNLARARLNGIDFSNANLSGANLSKADLSGANLLGTVMDVAILRESILKDADLSEASLKNADLHGANLSGAKLVDSDLTNAQMRVADMMSVLFEPQPGSLPDILHLASAYNLAAMRFSESPHGLVELREAFREKGLRRQEREITYAFKHTERLNSWRRNDIRSKIESLFNLLLFELTCDYGMSPGKAILLLTPLLFLFAICYISVLIRPPGKEGIWKVWSQDRVRKDLGCQEPVLLHLKFLPAVIYGIYFSILSAFSIGWREFNVGSWIARIQPREYTLRASGWVRTVAGIQSLISVYLLALWVLAYFGRPFE